MLSRSERKRIRAVGRRKGREREGLFLAEGVRVVEELLAAGVEIPLVVTSPDLIATDRGAALRARLDEVADVRDVSEAELRGLADTSTTQGVLVVAKSPAAELDGLRTGAQSVVLVLDGVQDPGNLGTLARSAAAFGCDALVALSGTVDPWNPKSVRASAGALFRLPVVQPSLSELGAWLKGHGYVLMGADAAGESVSAPSLPQRVALAVGNEGAGLSEGVAARCERMVSVPMRGGTESLNVAVAGAIVLYELTRERG